VLPIKTIGEPRFGGIKSGGGHADSNEFGRLAVSLFLQPVRRGPARCIVVVMFDNVSEKISVFGYPVLHEISRRIVVQAASLSLIGQRDFWHLRLKFVD